MPPPTSRRRRARSSPSPTSPRSFGNGAQHGRRARRRHARRRAGRVRLPARRVGLRQEHAAQPRRRASTSPPSGEVDVRAERTGLMFQEAALFPWLTVRGNVELALKLAGCRPRRTARPRRRAARHGAPRRLRQAAAARALGRHAPTGRARPRARAGRRRAAHGRAVRRARRDDARPARTTSSRRCGHDAARPSSS